MKDRNGNTVSINDWCDVYSHNNPTKYNWSAQIYDISKAEDNESQAIFFSAYGPLHVPTELLERVSEKDLFERKLKGRMTK